MTDPSTPDIVAALSQPFTELGSVNLGRRRFLQAIAAGIALSAMPPWLAAHHAAASPYQPGEGVLVLVTMAGGNDGLSTFVPVHNGHYRDLRGNLAIDAGSTLALTASRGLHPNLPYFKKLWDTGNLAVIEGVGHDDPNLSHFISMAQYMAATTSAGHAGTGWLGRIGDNIGGTNPFSVLAVSPSVPLLILGRKKRGVAVSHRKTDLFPLGSERQAEPAQHQAIKYMARGDNGLGPLGNMLADTAARSVDLSARLMPVLEDEREEPEPVSQMRLAARLINANLGTRVISVLFGDFDSHANQVSMHNARMSELNAALETFFATLNPAMAGRTLVVGTSEFGRRPAANGSGTDHGTTNALFAAGQQVKGGFHGQFPSLQGLGQWGNPTPTVDFRNVYADVVTTWFGADPVEIIGRNYSPIGFLRAPSDAPSKLGFTAPEAGSVVAKRASVIRLYFAYFGRPPDDDGLAHWSDVVVSGGSLSSVSAAFAASAEFRQRYGRLSNADFVTLVYRNVLGRAPDGAGAGHWRGVLDRGGSRGSVMTQFSESAEYKKASATAVWRVEQTGPIGRLYLAYFGRPADRAGLSYWLNSGSSAATVSQSLASSAEFGQRYGNLDNAGFVDLVYRNVLDRPADAAGRKHWVSQLDRGLSRGQVMLSFSNSPEFKARVQTMV